MTTIQSITVRIKDGIKTGDYAPNKEYDLTATCEGDADLDAVVDRLRRAGDRFLGRNVTVVSEPAARVEAKFARLEGADVTGPQPDELPQLELPRHEPVKTAPSATPTSRTKASATPAATVSQPAEAASIPTQSAEQSSASPADPLAGTEPIVGVTDDDLTTAVAKKRGAVGEAGVGAIRSLLESFNPNPGQPFVLRGIPKPQRQAFLNKLHDLKVIGTVAI